MYWPKRRFCIEINILFVQETIIYSQSHGLNKQITLSYNLLSKFVWTKMMVKYLCQFWMLKVKTFFTIYWYWLN